MSSPCPAAKESTGCLLCRTTCSCPISPRIVPGFEDNSNLELGDTCTGKSSWRCARKVLFRQSRQPLETDSMPSYHEVNPQTTTSGRTRPQLSEPALNLGNGHSNGTIPRTGMQSGLWQHQATSLPYQHRYEYRATTRSEASALIIRNQLEWSELAMYSGVELALVSHGQLGRPPVWTLILKIRTRSSGVDTLARTLLLSTNLEEELTSVTYCDGLTDTLSLWKLKDPPAHSAQARSGSPAM